jgi:hypothetical protein
MGNRIRGPTSVAPCGRDHRHSGHRGGELAIIEGTLVRLKAERLSKERKAPPVSPGSSKTGAAPAEVDRWRQGFLKRFDLEHTFRFVKQTLGWTTPKLRTPEAPDRWT